MSTIPLRLGVNIDHVATLRQARHTTYPDLLDAAAACSRGGAAGITVHLREDRRHVQDRDVRALRDALTVPLNLEMANAPEIVRIALEIRPDEVCLVPEKRAELTTEGGLDVRAHAPALAPTVAALRDAGIAVSLFIDPDPAQLDAAAALSVPCVELHTGAFCDARDTEADRHLDMLIQAADHAHGLGLQVNAGHGISLSTIASILRVPHLDTLNIGHSIVAHAIFVGIEQATRAMLQAMADYRGGNAAP